MQTSICRIEAMARSDHANPRLVIRIDFNKEMAPKGYIVVNGD